MRTRLWDAFKRLWDLSEERQMAAFISFVLGVSTILLLVNEII